MIALNRIFPKESKRREIAKRIFSTTAIPEHLSAKFKEIDKAALDTIKLSLENNYFADYPEGYLSADFGKNDLLDHLYRRLVNNRTYIIWWLDNTKPLYNANILEIGCGTGSSTVALAEQGAKVTAIDMYEPSLIVAKERCKVYDLDVEFFNANATEIYRLFTNRRFDFIIFYASLEHMTLEERMTSMKNTWEMLPSGGLWCVIDTPNRLWYYDFHTSFLPFYLWLPDDVAFKYSRFSRRNNFNELYREYNDESEFHFLRRGRGVSFHEFELTMKPLNELNVLSSMQMFNRRKRSSLYRLRSRFSTEYRYESFLVKMCPEIHRGFFQKTLDLIIKKD